MKRVICIALVLMLVVGAFVSCKFGPEKTEVGTWFNRDQDGELYIDYTLVLSEDGTLKMSAAGKAKVTETVIADVSLEISGTYEATSATEGTLSFTSGYTEVTYAGKTERTEIKPSSAQYTFDGKDALTIEGRVFSRKK